MGFRTYLNNIRSLYHENRHIIVMGIFGFIFLLCGIYILKNQSIPGGLLFCWWSVLFLMVGWFGLKYKGTDLYGKMITFTWADTTVPAWKKWAVITWTVIFLLLFCWTVISG